MYHPYHRELLLVDTDLGQTVGVIGMERAHSPLAAVAVSSINQHLLLLHESGSVSMWAPKPGLTVANTPMLPKSQSQVQLLTVRSHLFSLLCCRCFCRNHNHCQPFRPLLPQLRLQRQFSKSVTSLALPATMCGWAKTAEYLGSLSILYRRPRRLSSPLMDGFSCSP